MSNQIRPAYDPLTSENAALVLVDHQVCENIPSSANFFRWAESLLRNESGVAQN